MRKIEKIVLEKPKDPEYIELTSIRKVYLTPRGGLILTGIPPVVKSLDEENQHNCDEMGCGQEHVLLRINSNSLNMMNLIDVDLLTRYEKEK